MKCKAGDMAVVLSAFHKANVGRFVSVVKLYDNTGDAAMGWEQPVWLVESHAPMTWTKGAKVWQGHQGQRCSPSGAGQPAIRSQTIRASRSSERADSPARNVRLTSLIPALAPPLQAPSCRVGSKVLEGRRHLIS